MTWGTALGTNGEIVVQAWINCLVSHWFMIPDCKTENMMFMTASSSTLKGLWDLWNHPCETAYDIIWLIMGRVDGFVRVVSRQEGISVLPWWVGWCQLIIRKKDWELTHTKIQWSLLMHLFECGCTVIDVTHHPLVEWHRQFLMFGVKELKIPNQCFALPIL